MSPAKQDGKASAALLATRLGQPASYEQPPQTSHVGPSTSPFSILGQPCPGQAEVWQVHCGLPCWTSKRLDVEGHYSLVVESKCAPSFHWPP
eukprot:6483217-Amphidinium_carterae.1